MALATAALDVDAELAGVAAITAAQHIDPLLARIRELQAARRAFVTRIDRAQAERPCVACRSTPTVGFPRGRLCAACAPPQPRGYCAPNRCYCRSETCQRPA